MSEIEDNKNNVNQRPVKHKLTEEQLKSLLGRSCPGRQWFLMKKTTDFNKLALFLKINGVDSIELGRKAYTYEVDLKDETIGGAFILTEKEIGSTGRDGKKIGDDAAGRAVSADGAAGSAHDAGGASEGGAAGTRWYVAAAIVAPDFRGHGIGKIMSDKMKKLAASEGASAVYVNAAEDTPCPDDTDGAYDAGSFWEEQGFTAWEDDLLVCAL